MSNQTTTSSAPVLVAEVGPARVETEGASYTVTIGNTVIGGEASDEREAADLGLAVAVDELQSIARRLEALR